MQGSERTEDEELRSVALQNAATILLARRRAEQELLTAKEALRETSERLQLALSAGHLGDWSWDARTDLVSLSTRAADIFGLPHQKPVTWRALRDLLHEDDREHARIAVEQSGASRTDYDVEYRVRRPSGEECWVNAKGRPTYSHTGAVLGMTGIVQDITERRRAEEALRAIAIDNARLYEAAQKAAEERRELLESERAARAQAERANVMKDEFLATLSHELRTPLSAILGWAQVLRRGTRSADEVRQGLETIERNARIQTQLIEDLLDMSRIISGKLRLDLQTLEPLPVIEAALETVQPAAEAKGVRLEKILDPAAGPIAGDASRLQQVVWNLLSNAIKFTPKGGRVQVLLERVNSSIEVSVADTGIGIAPKFLPHVFERFRQADATSTRAFGGLGLGLSIVKDLVEMHGGSVHVSSAGEGRGTTFSVRLPLSAVHRIDRSGRLHPRAPQLSAPDFEHTDLNGIVVVVVDDDADARRLVGRVLEDCHARVLAAANVEEALVLLQRENADVLITDLGMPGSDGFELLRRARELNGEARKIPAVALTAFARSEDRTRALRAGFIAHVAKPVEPAELVATIAALTGRTGHPD